MPLITKKPGTRRSHPVVRKIAVIMAFALCLVGFRAASKSGTGSHPSLLLFEAATARASSSAASSSAATSITRRTKKKYRTVQVQVVHRHGDRTPITPLADETYWSSKLVAPTTLDKIAENTRLVRDDDAGFSHPAGGRGPFGKLTELGLLQMVQVGSTLRERLLSVTTKIDGNHDDDDEEGLFGKDSNKLDPSRLRIFSTDFPRTIQSVQGLLVGLFPDGIAGGEIPIDVRNTVWMIPDPQPRLSKEQEHLEKVLASRPKVLQKDKEMLPLALKATKALAPLLAHDAHKFVFGTSETDAEEKSSVELEPIAWNQLAEITKCLAVHEKLPSTLTHDDCEVINKYTAQRWFRNLKHPRLAKLALGRMVDTQMQIFTDRRNDNVKGDNGGQNKKNKCLTIWSAHDSTLIGLICAFRLQQPTKWPEYASYLIMELIEVESSQPASVKTSSLTEKKELMVRFSLNGEVLKSMWDDDSEPQDMIPLSVLVERIRDAGAVPETVASG